MKTHFSSLFVAAGIAAWALAAPTTASATPLHGFCLGSPCVDNGTNTPTDQQPPVFGFTSGGQSKTGDFLVGILVPNDNSPPASFTVVNANNSLQTWTANPLSTSSSWTSGKLGDYMTGLGKTDLTDGPGHPLDAYLPSTQVFDGAATGFWVYIADLGPQTLESNGNALNGLELTLSGQMPLGGYLLGFQNVCTTKHDVTTCSYSMNSNSGAILETDPNCPDCHTENVPEPLTLSLFGVGLLGAAAARGLRRKAKVA